MGIPNDFYANVAPHPISSSDPGLRISTSNSYKPSGSIANISNQEGKRPLEDSTDSPPKKIFAAQPPIMSNDAFSSDEEYGFKQGQETRSYPGVLPTPMRSATAEEEIATLKKTVAKLEERNKHYSDLIDNQRLEIDTLARDLERQSKQVQHAAKFKEVLFRYSDLLP